MTQTNRARASKWHGELPWKLILRARQNLNDVFFQKERPSGTYLMAEPDWRATRRARKNLDRIKRSLGSAGFRPQPWSYDKGEDLSLAFTFHRDDANYEWWQVHVRVWLDEEGSAYMRPHLELAPEYHPKEHLDGVGFETDVAFERVSAVLSGTGIETREVKW